jgi:hypothetical protein
LLEATGDARSADFPFEDLVVLAAPLALFVLVEVGFDPLFGVVLAPVLGVGATAKVVLEVTNGIATLWSTNMTNRYIA